MECIDEMQETSEEEERASQLTQDDWELLVGFLSEELKDRCAQCEKAGGTALEFHSRQFFEEEWQWLSALPSEEHEVACVPQRLWEKFQHTTYDALVDPAWWKRVEKQFYRIVHPMLGEWGESRSFLFRETEAERLMQELTHRLEADGLTVSLEKNEEDVYRVVTQHIVHNGDLYQLLTGKSEEDRPLLQERTDTDFYSVQGVLSW